MCNLINNYIAFLRFVVKIKSKQLHKQQKKHIISKNKAKVDDFFTSQEGTDIKMKIKEIIQATKGTLVQGNSEEEIKVFCKDTRIIKKGDTYIGI